MTFTADKQTLDDLNLLGKYKSGSVFSLFNRVRTGGGERLLEELFKHPLSDVAEINRRSATFQYFGHRRLEFPFSREKCSVLEDYLGTATAGNLLTTMAVLLTKRLLEMIVRDRTYRAIQDGVLATVGFLYTSRLFLDALDPKDDANPIKEQLILARKTLSDTRLGDLPSQEAVVTMPWQKVVRLHHLFTKVLRQELADLFATLYEVDVYIAVSNIAREKDFSYAKAAPVQDNVLFAENLHHPCLSKAVGNTLSLDSASNVLFLTGANMAGKSTLMKSLGIAVYLAHMGFPVAADQMRFSIRDGLYSSINVPDDLALGYSHFYAEVQRVKTIAEAVSDSKALLVIFDELFKGTNVKDAFDATLAVTAAFAAYRNCWFVISTHIIEVGEQLRIHHNNVQFAYLPTVMEGSSPRYTYQLAAGITNDRHGMMIIEQEGILDIIRNQSI